MKWLRLLLRLKAVKFRTLVLTFDDGPGSRLTLPILKILADYNAKATFFLLGRNIAGQEEIVRQIAEQGHEICSHGYDHLHYWKVSPIRAIRDIKRGWQVVDNTLGTTKQKYPFRPPYGKLNIVCLLYLFLRNVPIIYWSLDTRDTWYPKPNNQRLSVLAKQAGGAVVLVHDFDRSDNAADDMVLKFIHSAIATAKIKNMRILTISEFLNYKQ
jgi:peptidoglycan/xylan/chitin deacetylase (PgdA/CDA1 family)